MLPLNVIAIESVSKFLKKSFGSRPTIIFLGPMFESAKFFLSEDVAHDSILSS